MTTLRPWLEVARPRKDIEEGSFADSLFAAEIGAVDKDIGPEDYRDPRRFCEQTYLTTSLRAVLVEIGKRLTDVPGAAGVYRLQTEFGGGKTHTMLAAYHLFRDPERVEDTELGLQVADFLPQRRLPKAKVVVLDGGALSAGTAEEPESGVQLTTLLGHLAYALGGREEWQAVASADLSMHGLNNVALVRLLSRHTPCLILLDEALEYLNKALTVRAHDTNLASVTLTFIKDLITAVVNTPRAAILATLTSSYRTDYADDVASDQMQVNLSRIVGRTESIVTPVEGDDVFPILHRRLFQAVGGAEEREAAAAAYSEYYAAMGDILPARYSEQSYRDRIRAAYPFHPELVDILTNRWGSLSGFQRTRGALRMLAHTVKALAQRRTNAALIHPGDVPLEDADVRAEALRVAGESFKAALNADITRPDSKAVEEDERRGAQARAVRLSVGLATTAFLESFGPDKVLGASAAQLVIGAGRPGISRGLLEDVRDALENRLWYLRLEGGRYRFTAEANLNRVVFEREGSVLEARIVQMLRDTIREVAPDDRLLRIVPWVHDSIDLPDDRKLTLGVLDFEHTMNGGATAEVLQHAQTILEQRGSVFRNNRNAAMLLVADLHFLTRARLTARTLAALGDVSDDDKRLRHFNKEQREQLAKRLEGATELLPQQIVMTYRHLVLLGETDGRADLDKVELGPAQAGATLAGRVVEYLRSADRLAERLAPATLLSSRFGLLPEGTDAIELDRLLAWFSQLVRLPKLARPEVLRDCLVEGVRGSFFGLVAGSRWDADDAVIRFGVPVDPGEVQFQPGAFLVRASRVRDLLARRATPNGGPTAPAPAPPQAGGGAGSPSAPVVTPAPTVRSKAITGVTVTLKDVPADRARDVVKVAVLPLSAAGGQVAVDMVITAQGGIAGISRDTVDLVVAEGLRQLGLRPDIQLDEESDS